MAADCPLDIPVIFNLITITINGNNFLHAHSFESRCSLQGFRIFQQLKEFYKAHG